MEIGDPIHQRLVSFSGEKIHCVCGEVVEYPSPTPRDDWVSVGRLLLQPAPRSPDCVGWIGVGFFRGVSHDETVASDHVVLVWALFLHFGREPSWGRSGRWQAVETVSFGRTPIACILQ
jgi:hypothetical protein